MIRVADHAHLIRENESVCPHTPAGETEPCRRCLNRRVWCRAKAAENPEKERERQREKNRRRYHDCPRYRAECKARARGHPLNVSTRSMLARAQRAGVAVEVVIREDVIEQTDGRCYLCGVSIPRGMEPAHPLKFEVEHRVPLSKGGSHDLSNCYPAHRLCNAAKGTSHSLNGQREECRDRVYALLEEVPF